MKKIFYDTNDLKLIKNEIKKIFFYRVCGTGMGAAATLLKEAGYIVEGGDNEFYPPMSTYLENSEVQLKKISDCNDDYLKEFDLIIVGNVVPRESKDARRLESLGVNLTSFPQALGGLLLDAKKVIGIAGTHGKTTSTYLGAQVLSNLGEDVGYFIGGVLPSGPSAQIGKSDIFIIEADEYDSAYFEKTSKFHHFGIDSLIITSLEFDHADIFKNEKELSSSFEKLLKGRFSRIIYNSDYSMLKNIFNSPLRNKNIKDYGLDGSHPGLRNVLSKDNYTSFELKINGQFEKISTNLTGIHNILNLTSIVLLTYDLGFSITQIKKAVLRLDMVKRRQELKGTIKNALIFDDFAHHPTAIQTTLKSLRSLYAKKEIIAIFEPVSSTARSNFFQEQFVDSLKVADIILVIPPRRDTSALLGKNLDVELLCKRLQNLGRIVFQVFDLEDLEERVLALADEKKVIITLSNGKVYNLFSSDIIKT